ncbi:hypothetical protein K488DRAFT_49693 [Vararia minispora EC-137]|uniref:Uncharacterized protein n=1 Tax=Vararia minispora EC-137 TaxID=1314806 RepID=A0ACB8QL06_9AGAM|nr:hypothetical protein K488DRAFT_49693 [Vararia minispora EC-137]
MNWENRLRYLRNYVFPPAAQTCHQHNIRRITRTGELPSSLRRLHTNSGDLPIPPYLPILETPQDWRAARDWLELFQRSKILKRHVEITFSRSSGPGGQNVNKVNTKATLRISLHSRWIPQWAHRTIQKSPHYAPSSQSILLTSTATRSQAQNVQDVLAKLRDLVITSATADVKNEPSEEQRRRVERHQRAEKARRREEKAYRSEKKKSRSVVWDD